MGNVVASLMDRRNTNTLTPCTFVHKYNNYGANNLPYSAASDTCSAIYRMKHFPDDVFDNLSDVYYYRLGNTVSNLKTLCARRGDAPAAAYRPVERVEVIMVPDPHQRQAAGGKDAATQPAAAEEVKTVSRSITHYGERVVLSYTELWASIEHFGVGLRAAVERSRLAIHNADAKRRDNLPASPPPHQHQHQQHLHQQQPSSVAGAAAIARPDPSHNREDESTAHIPARPHHAFQKVPLRGMAAPRIAIFEETRWEWISTIFGLWTQGFVAVTVYANLGEEALTVALEEASCDAVVCNGRSVPLLFHLMEKGRLPWSGIVYLDDLPADFAIPMDTADGKRLAQVLSPWSALVAEGRAALAEMALGDGTTAAGEDEEDADAEALHPAAVRHAHPAALSSSRSCSPRLPASNDHLALIMYTSGTTGKPKGVMHTHGSIAAGVETLNDKLVWIEPYLPRDKQTYCAFLPLAHIMEFVCINLFLHRGFLVCFSNPRTLTSEFARPHGDFAEYKPLVIMAVPRIFDVLRKSVLASLPPPGTLKRRIFNQAYASRLDALRHGYDTPYYNAKVFAKIREAFGGRMVLMLSGGGLLSEATHEFVNVAMGLVVEGYGLTETVACGSTQMIGSLQYNNCGELMKSCEVKLQDTQYYKHTDKPEPRGEILLRGPFLFKGYYNQPELTKAALDDDGWFHTGDIGSIAVADNNVLRVVGRVKALAKNASGEYIPMEALEAIYSGNDLSLPNSTCLIVHPHRNYVCAIALTEKKNVAAFLAKHPDLANRLTTTTYPDVLADPVFRAAVAESFRQTAVAAKRRPFELVRHVRLLNDVWSPEDGTLTAALKLRRMKLETLYKDIIVEMFMEE